MQNWQLPEHFSDILPEQAWTLEEKKMTLLQLYRQAGFQYVIPSVMEYSKQIAIGKTLQTHSIGFLDHLTGEQIALRADFTPQIARLDSHVLKTNNIQKLCYAGVAVHSRPLVPACERELFQVGAELYGDASIHADALIIDLALQSVTLLGLAESTLTLNLSGIHLLPQICLQQEHNYQALQQKSITDLDHDHHWILNCMADSNELDFIEKQLHEHQNQYGKQHFAEAYQSWLEIKTLIIQLKTKYPQLNIVIDLADVPSFEYHTGIYFSVYHQQSILSIARGGRYDNIAKQLGYTEESRPATGFSLNLREFI